MVLLFSVGLADRINTMRKDIQRHLDEQLENERSAGNGRSILEGIVDTANIISEEFSKVSRDLNVISDTFAMLSRNRPSTSEEMSATFEELTSSTEHIHNATLNQKDEGEKSKRWSGSSTGGPEKHDPGKHAGG